MGVGFHVDLLLPMECLPGLQPVGLLARLLTTVFQSLWPERTAANTNHAISENPILYKHARTHYLVTLKPRHIFNKLRWIQTQIAPCFRNIGQDTNNPTQQAHVRMFSSENRHSKQRHRRACTQEGIPIPPSWFLGVRGGHVSRPMHQMKDPQHEDSPTF